RQEVDDRFVIGEPAEADTMATAWIVPCCLVESEGPGAVVPTEEVSKPGFCLAGLEQGYAVAGVA
ncbi:hypothetical protein CRG98_048896, partial [Punica granatum]